MTAPDGLLRDAGGARPASDVDALIERLRKEADDVEGYTGEALREAAATLVQLRFNETLANSKIERQMIEVARLTTKCKYGDPMCPCQDGDACHYEGDNPMTPPPIKARIAALEAERDAAIASAPTQGALGEALKIVQAERDAMRHLALWMRSQTSCENYHHDKREQHSGSECPVEARIDAELNWRKP